MFEILIPVLIAGGTIGALLLSRRAAPIAAYRVAVLGVDETKAFTVTAIGEAKASLTRLHIRGKQTDGSMKDFDILAGQVPSAVPGADNLRFEANDIITSNVGTISGTLFIRVSDDLLLQRGYFEGVRAVGFFLANTAFSLAMQPRSYGLVVEVGHL